MKYKIIALILFVSAIVLIEKSPVISHAQAAIAETACQHNGMTFAMIIGPADCQKIHDKLYPPDQPVNNDHPGTSSSNCIISSVTTVPDL